MPDRWIGPPGNPAGSPDVQSVAICRPDPNEKEHECLLKHTQKELN